MHPVNEHDTHTDHDHDEGDHCCRGFPTGMFFPSPVAHYHGYIDNIGASLAMTAAVNSLMLRVIANEAGMVAQNKVLTARIHALEAKVVMLQEVLSRPLEPVQPFPKPDKPVKPRNRWSRKSTVEL